MSDRPILARIRHALAGKAAPGISAVQVPKRAAVKGVSGVELSGFSFIGQERLASITYLEGPLAEQATAYAVSAYAYIAMRYRAEKLGEPALMVVAEDKDDASEEWLPEHPLAAVLEEPSPDYDMGELLYRTSLYLDMGGACLWVANVNGLGTTGRLTPYRQSEFKIEGAPGRIRGRFLVQEAKGEKEYSPDQVLYFSEPNPNDWLRGQSRLDVALSWLNLSERTRRITRELLDHAVWPSLVVQPNHEWNPDEKALELFKQELAQYGKTKGKPLVILGGGSATVVAQQIKEILPEGLLNRVESIVAAVFGIPAIVLQYQVGMENAPWSQMEEARRMCTEDTLDPRWRFVERIMTRQLLRKVDDDPTHFIRFDRSTVKGLQADRLEQASLAQLMARDASLNERRQLVGLEPIADPAADDIPALQPPPPNPFAPPGGGGDPFAGGEDGEDVEEPEEEEEEEVRAGSVPKRRRGLARKARRVITPPAWDSIQREGLELSWQILADRQLAIDAAHINDLALRILGSSPEGKQVKALDDVPDERARRRFLTAVAGYLKGTSEPRWARATAPLMRNSIYGETSVVAADLGIRFDLLQPEVESFVRKENRFLVRSLGDTTATDVQDILSQGLEAGQSTRSIARALQEAHTFSPARSKLIARTEVGRAQNGAAQESITAFGERTGRIFEKVWDNAGDGRVRDEHREPLNGESVPINRPFSNGLMYPSEPNCRCRARYREVTTR